MIAGALTLETLKISDENDHQILTKVEQMRFLLLDTILD